MFELLPDKTTPDEPTDEQLKKEVAGIERSLSELLFYGGGVPLLINGDDVLRTRGRGKGLAIYSELQRDAHVKAVMGKRKRAVTAREWGVTPSSDDAQDVACAKLVEETLKRMRFDKATKALLDGVLKGFSVIEWLWDVVDGSQLDAPGKQYLVPVKYKKRDQRRFTFDIHGNPRLLTKENSFTGEALPDRKFTVYTYGDEDDDSPYGRGEGYSIFWPVFFKRQNLSFWLVFNEKFGSPTAKGSYPSGTGNDEQKKLLATLQSISRNAGIIFPEGMEVELLEAARSGGGDGYERLCHYCDAEISKAILGETQTTTVGNSGGNRALGDVHNEVRMELAKDDADDVCAALNATIVKWICEYNFPGRNPPTVWRDFEEAEDLDLVAARDKKLKDLGWERNDESFTETYGDGYVRVQQPTQPTGTDVLLPPNAPRVEFSEPKASVFERFLRFISFADRDPVAAQQQRNREVQDMIAENAELLAGEWEKFVGPQFAELQTLLDETGDLNLFRERLMQLIDKQPNEALVESVARATFAASLAGRLPRTK